MQLGAMPSPSLRPAGAGAAVWSAAGAGGASPVAAGAAMTSAGAGGVDAGAGPDLPPAALTTIGPAPAPAAYRRALAQAAERAALSPDLLAALVWQESRWNSRARSRAGALGLGQLMPGTADMLGVNPHDPAQNLIGAATYLRQQLDRFDNNVELALAAYNAGPRRVARAGAVPAIAETRTYVATITRQLAGRVRGD